jgi:ribosomal protein L11 methyltransferase
MDADEGLRLWRASATTRGPEMPDLLDGFDDAVSVSLFEVEDEATAAALGWRVDLLFREPPDEAGLGERLRRACAAAGAELAGIEVAAVAQEDWVAAAQLRLPPLAAGRFVVHGSHVARGDLPPGLEPIEVDAGLAFGSGEHATTRSCLLAIDRLARRRRRFRRVLDLGCGSGVLAIAALRCWPSARAVAVDNDPIAARVAAGNLRLNAPAARWAVARAKGYGHPLVRRGRPFDLILANILADPLVELAPALARHLAPGGTAVLSGLLDRQAEAVAAAHAAQGLRPAGRIDKGPWVGLTFRKPARRRAESHRPESAPR